MSPLVSGMTMDSRKESHGCWICFDRVGVTVTSHMVGSERWKGNPHVAKEIVERGHEASGHGQTWTPQFSMTPDEERTSYQASIKTIETATGTRPVGFNAFWLRGTSRTLEISQDLGFIYHIDDVSRDEPFLVAVRNKPFAVVPYADSTPMTSVNYERAVHWTGKQFASELKYELRSVSLPEAGDTSTHDVRQCTRPHHLVVPLEPGLWKSSSSTLRGSRRCFLRKDQIARFALESSSTPREGFIDATTGGSAVSVAERKDKTTNKSSTKRQRGRLLQVQLWAFGFAIAKGFSRRRVLRSP